MRYGMYIHKALEKDSKVIPPKEKRALQYASIFLDNFSLGGVRIALVIVFLFGSTIVPLGHPENLQWIDGRPMTSDDNVECSAAPSTYILLIWYAWVIPFTIFFRRVIDPKSDPYQIVGNLTKLTVAITFGIIILLSASFYLVPIIGSAHTSLIAYWGYWCIMMTIWYTESYRATRQTYKHHDATAQGDYGLSHTLEDTLVDPDLLQRFEEHLIQEWATENLMFYKSVVLFELEAEAKVLELQSNRKGRNMDSSTHISIAVITRSRSRSKSVLEITPDHLVETIGQRALGIYVKYLEEDSPFQVNLPSRIIKSVDRFFRQDALLTLRDDCERKGIFDVPTTIGINLATSFADNLTRGSRPQTPKSTSKTKMTVNSHFADDSTIGVRDRIPGQHKNDIERGLQVNASPKLSPEMGPVEKGLNKGSKPARLQRTISVTNSQNSSTQNLFVKLKGSTEDEIIFYRNRKSSRLSGIGPRISAPIVVNEDEEMELSLAHATGSKLNYSPREIFGSSSNAQSWILSKPSQLNSTQSDLRHPSATAKMNAENEDQYEDMKTANTQGSTPPTPSETEPEARSSFGTTGLAAPEIDVAIDKTLLSSGVDLKTQSVPESRGTQSLQIPRNKSRSHFNNLEAKPALDRPLSPVRSERPHRPASPRMSRNNISASENQTKKRISNDPNGNRFPAQPISSRAPATGGRTTISRGRISPQPGGRISPLAGGRISPLPGGRTTPLPTGRISPTRRRHFAEPVAASSSGKRKRGNAYFCKAVQHALSQRTRRASLDPLNDSLIPNNRRSSFTKDSKQSNHSLEPVTEDEKGKREVRRLLTSMIRIFGPAKREVFRLMERDSHRRFVASADFRHSGCSSVVAESRRHSRTHGKKKNVTAKRTKKSEKKVRSANL
eukprot:CAMPEP_0114495132 /NCGR_PEP_ID=MMETSP0109-20121206/5038_1 /TAXON_ID=29199 /ORGANISM="Chlorarachnion reptans, Strain CCCM449" /LENGTH=896 /DNA_ID=CAMNT_0001672247 /DNA_START=367 /DNA_END=3057 /DNA_ORIENTATION=+